MSMTIKGIIKQIDATQVVSEKFSKRTFRIQTADQYPQVIELQLTQAKCDLLDKFSIGQEVEVSINIRGREWTNDKGEVKCFNTIEAWKIDLIGANSSAPVTNNNEPTNDLPWE